MNGVTLCNSNKSIQMECWLHTSHMPFESVLYCVIQDGYNFNSGFLKMRFDWQHDCNLLHELLIVLHVAINYSLKIMNLSEFDAKVCVYRDRYKFWRGSFNIAAMILWGYKQLLIAVKTVVLSIITYFKKGGALWLRLCYIYLQASLNYQDFLEISVRRVNGLSLQGCWINSYLCIFFGTEFASRQISDIGKLIVFLWVGILFLYCRNISATHML